LNSGREIGITMCRGICFCVGIVFIHSTCSVALGGTYSGGSGTGADPYRISTTANWTSLIASPGDWGKNFVLTANLDFAGANFNPVGNGTTFFTGVMDGAGHTLSNFRMRISQPIIDNVGLFGVVTGGQIKNLGVVNAAIRGNWYVGALVGDNNGTITSCYATGAITGTSSVGGLAGYNSGTITTCYSTVTVVGNTDTGGLVGANIGTITYCYAAGAVSGTNSVGGLVGVNYSGVYYCFWDTQTSGQTTSAGGTGKTMAEMKTLGTFTAAGWDFANTWWMPAGGYPRLMWELGYGSLQVTIEPLEAVADGAQWCRVGPFGWLNSGQIETSVSARSWDVQFKPTVHWQQPEPIQVAVSANGLTQLTATYTRLYSGGSGTAADPYRIGSVADWQALTLHAHSADWDKNFILTADIDFGGATFTPVGYSDHKFTGVLDGAGHTLSNFGIIKDDSGVCLAGLFGIVGSGGQVKNLGVANADIWAFPLSSLPRLEGVGCLVGYNDGGTITSCYATGVVSGEVDVDYVGVGGLVGINTGTITSCYARGPVIGSNYSVGGLVGGNSGTITSCYATGIVGGRFPCGLAFGGTITGCFWDFQTSRTVRGAGTFKSTAEMKQQSTFAAAGWDFVNVWEIVENVSYPTLRAVPQPVVWSADLNGDGRVDLADFALFAGQWMK
jgi:hypothetical protein